LRILLLTEGTYPYANGGVSTWCHELVHALEDVEFDLLALTGDPTLAPLFKVPANVNLRNVAMWGTRSAWETRTAQSYREERERVRGADRPPAELLSALRILMRETLGAQHDDDVLCDAIESLHRIFLEHDMDMLLRSAETWELVRSELLELLPAAARRNGYEAPGVTLEEVAEVRRWFAHWLTPLAAPLPRTDVVHAAMAGTCTLIAVAANRVHGAASVLSEHGIYLREVYLAEQRAADGLTGKLVRIGFAKRMTELHYATADRVAPVCKDHRRWETRYGVDAERLRTVYLGLDAERFPVVERGLREAPVVAWAGRIDPLKDVETLLHAAALVIAERPEVTFKLYGSAHPDARAYEEKCRQLWRELELESNVHFQGWTSSTAEAFADADVVALTSISEGFPFSTLEALFSGRPVVATAVGGVPEQVIESCGKVVPPRDARAFADAVLELIDDPERWQERSDAARTWAAENFGIETFALEHRSLYEDARVFANDVAVSNSNGQAGRQSRVVAMNNARGRPGAVGNVHGIAAVSGNGRAGALGSGNGNGQPHGRVDIAAVSNAHGGTAVLERPGATMVSAQVVQAESADQHHERLRAPLADLAEQIAGRLRMPLHADEATATLESLGVTDAVAEGSYGSTDTFALAHSLWPRICEIAAERTAFGTPPPTVRRAPIIDAAMRGATALAPLAALLAVIGLFAEAGWPVTQLLSLSAGITLALVLSAGPATAMVFRASVLIGVGQVHSADRFLLRTCGLFFGASVLVMLAILPFTLFLDVSNTDRATFCGALVASSAVWLLTARLVAGGRAGVAALCIVGGLLAGFAYAQLTGGAAHAAFAGAAGAGVACSLALAAGGAPPNAARRLFYVPRVRLALELSPFARYGALALLILIAPHIAAWIAAARQPQAVLAVGDFEIGTTLALLPAMTTAALVAVYNRRVWQIAVEMQHTTRAERPAALEHALRAHHTSSVRKFVLAVAGLSLALAAILAIVVPTGKLDGFATIDDPSAVAAIFCVSLVGYAALGVGQLSAGYAMGLASPAGPARAATGGVVIGLVVALALALALGPGWAVGGLAAGTITFAVLAIRATDRLLDSAAFHYATVF
jgi:glycosyltransferase involved in cell wall biosynthesis